MVVAKITQVSKKLTERILLDLLKEATKIPLYRTKTQDPLQWRKRNNQIRAITWYD